MTMQFDIPPWMMGLTCLVAVTPTVPGGALMHLASFHQELVCVMAVAAHHHNNCTNAADDVVDWACNVDVMQNLQLPKHQCAGVLPTHHNGPGPLIQRTTGSLTQVLPST